MTPNPNRAPRIAPWDIHNQNLTENVHPSNWVNPKPAAHYNLVVIGAGAAGLITAAGAAGLGAKVALVEKNFLGGDCLNVGCVPSKAILRAARAVAELNKADEFGISIPSGARIDFPRIMERMRKLRAAISRNDAAERYRQMGVDVFLGNAKFTGPETTEVNGASLHFAKAVIATGGRAILLPIPGLAESGAFTNETVFSLTELPRRLAIIGAGPIGCELAQAFRRFGSQVTLLEIENQILPREDHDAAQVLRRQFEKEGINLLCDTRIDRIESASTGKTIHYSSAGRSEILEADDILVSAGRTPNVEGLGLEAAGVEYTKHGVTVNDFLQTSNPRIYAAGDICLRHKFTHAADASARLVLRNALFAGRQRFSSLIIPWCTYTDPEIAQVGFSDDEARKAGVEINTITQKFDEVDRAILDGETDGFVKVHVRDGTDQICGATIIGSHAGEMIGEITMAMTAKIGLSKLANVIHSYPTQAEAIKKVADAYNRTRLTPLIKKLIGHWLNWTH